MYMFFCLLFFFLFFFSSCVWNTLYFFMFGTSINKLKGAVIELLFTVFYCTSFPLVYFPFFFTVCLSLPPPPHAVLFALLRFLSLLPFQSYSSDCLFSPVPFLSRPCPFLSRLPFLSVLSLWSPIPFLSSSLPVLSSKMQKLMGLIQSCFKKVIFNLSTDLQFQSCHPIVFC